MVAQRGYAQVHVPRAPTPFACQAKFDSGCGWPAFDKIVEGAVVTKTDTSIGMVRVEIMCSGCGGHLGHVSIASRRGPSRACCNAHPDPAVQVFENERFTTTNERHCVNSVSMKYSTHLPHSCPTPATSCPLCAACHLFFPTDRVIGAQVRGGAVARRHGREKGEAGSGVASAGTSISLRF
jgi:peptide methionine sulfoxide reductase MsrB